jgi:hypothetical protein
MTWHWIEVEELWEKAFSEPKMEIVMPTTDVQCTLCSRICRKAYRFWTSDWDYIVCGDCAEHPETIPESLQQRAVDCRRRAVEAVNLADHLIESADDWDCCRLFVRIGARC